METDEVPAARRIGQVIRSARLSRGLTAEAAAHQAEVAPKTWARAEVGEGIRRSSWVRIARALGLPEGAILGALHQDDGHVGLATALGVMVPGDQDPRHEPRRTMELVRYLDEHSVEAVAFYVVDRLDRLRRADPGNPRNPAILAVVDAIHGFLHWRPESTDQEPT